MTKLGTPIGAGPKVAIVVVGLETVGVPSALYWGGGLTCLCWSLLPVGPAPPVFPLAPAFLPPFLPPGLVPLLLPVLPPEPPLDPPPGVEGGGGEVTGGGGGV